ncbi:phage holin family protein [Paenibacillus lemnae]|nr:phage holin family protein [Paenibacillus lemnae]
MGWTVIYEMIDPRLLMVVSACWVIGYILKNTPKVPDWSIVYIIIAVAIGLTSWMLGWNVGSVIQGILAGAFSVLGHQAVKQAGKRGDDS